MVLLVSSSYFDVRNNVDSAREAHARVWVYASDVLNLAFVLDRQLLEEALKGSKAVANIIFVGIAS